MRDFVINVATPELEEEESNASWGAGCKGRGGEPRSTGDDVITDVIAELSQRPRTCYLYFLLNAKSKPSKHKETHPVKRNQLSAGVSTPFPRTKHLRPDEFKYHSPPSPATSTLGEPVLSRVTQMNSFSPDAGGVAPTPSSCSHSHDT